MSKMRIRIQRGVHTMLRTITFALVTAIAVGSAALVPASAHGFGGGGWHGGGYGYRSFGYSSNSNYNSNYNSNHNGYDSYDSNGFGGHDGRR
jgi:hypothetical protein